uniref:Uncharacterized protein n=1 Tax=Amphimedon queenslandica TaxID=400682 RepID=A0A1X7TKJ0_AMPQE
MSKKCLLIIDKSIFISYAFVLYFQQYIMKSITPDKAIQHRLYHFSEYIKFRLQTKIPDFIEIILIVCTIMD